MTRRARIGVFLAAGAALGALLLWAYAGLPGFGHYRGPYGFVLNRIATPERHVTNVVNATTYDIRGFDTLGEEYILFAAVVGVVLLLRGRSGHRDAGDRVHSDLVRAGGTIMVGGVALVGLWLVAFGFVTPGGGFQGGVVVAAGLLLLYLAVGYRAWSAAGDERHLDPLEAIGAGGYVVVGLVALAIGLPFLKNMLGGGDSGTIWSGGSASFVNWAAAIEVAAANLVLYSEFLKQYIVPIARRRG
ncbi:MAG: sodium:proton antiporter [Acidobacteriota bacterium]|nr:sodium:proton antiporter [Acidobacteriota bacterium]MDE3191957.1 sodium:proton antiporter [Acidobacteriota bacterium]